MTAVTIGAERDITITPHRDGSVTIEGLTAEDMPLAEPEAKNSIITFTNKTYGNKVVGIKGDYRWHLMENDGDSESASWEYVLSEAQDGTLRTFPAPRS